MASVTLIQRAQIHLQSVIDEPSTKLDVSLLERVRRESLASITSDDRLSLISLVVTLLQNIQQDPTPATKLAEELVEPFSFSDVLQLQPPVDLVAGLKAPSPPVQLLVIRLLSLAVRHVGDVGIVAGNADLVATLVEVWLRSSDIAVAESAKQTISSLALAEINGQHKSVASGAAFSEGPQQGLMQRRIFKDKSIYGLMFALPSFSTSGQPGQLSKIEKTLAQGRLLDLLKEIWPLTDVWQSQMPEIEQLYGLKPGQGLLHFAALNMIDKSDVLLRVTQLDFFTDLITSISAQDGERETADQLLSFLTTTGVHDEILSIYTSPESHDPLDMTFHYAPAARYVAAYSQGYYEQLLSDTGTRTKIFKRLHEVLDAVPNSQWARNDGPGNDLHVLVSLPRLALVPDPILVNRLPTRPASADVFKALAHLFSGRLAADTNQDGGTEVLSFPTPSSGASHVPSGSGPQSRPWQQAEQWAARHLFLAYIDRHPSFWSNVIDASSVTAFRDTSVAAITLLHTIVRAQWQTEPGPHHFGLDIAGALADTEDGWYGAVPPANGVAAVIHPQVIDVLLPFIMKGPEGRGVGLLGVDPESAAYHIQAAKIRLTSALEAGIRETVTRLPDTSEEKAMLSDLAVGLAGLRRQGFERREEPGAEVGTMEL